MNRWQKFFVLLWVLMSCCTFLFFIIESRPDYGYFVFWAICSIPALGMVWVMQEPRKPSGPAN